jgi:hypothetical protein
MIIVISIMKYIVKVYYLVVVINVNYFLYKYDHILK